MLIGTAQWSEGNLTRVAVVSPLPSDPRRLVDLNQVERVRLAKMGEGRAEALAEVLVPSDLRRILESGSRSINRLRQTLVYAEKWHAKSSLPDSVAPQMESVRLLPCLPKPASLRRFDGTYLDRMSVRGPGSAVRGTLVPTLALLGHHPGRPAGICIAAEDNKGAVLGAWMSVETVFEDTLILRCQGVDPQEADLSIWQDLEIPTISAGELLLMPPPAWKTIPSLAPGTRLEIVSAFETLCLKTENEALHPTVQ
jgi:hypothetical protein